MTKRTLFFSAYVMALCAPTALAQYSNGYVVAGGGSDDGKWVSHAAIGGEKVFGKGFGLGGELGLIAGHATFAEISIDGYYHVPNSHIDRRLDPFVTGGYTSAHDLFSSANIGNVGAGVNYWFSPHLGVRVEFHDFVSGSGQFPVLRGGIAFH